MKCIKIANYVLTILTIPLSLLTVTYIKFCYYCMCVINCSVLLLNFVAMLEEGVALMNATSYNIMLFIVANNKCKI